MAQLLTAVKEVIWFRTSPNNIQIDSWTFKAFNQVTSGLLILSSVVVVARQFFGEPITCDPGVTAGAVKDEVLESYCWMYANFRIPPDFKGPCAGTDQGNDDTMLYNSYYQWVPIYLICLAVIFYLPRCIWLIMEGGLMKFFGKGTTTRVIEDPEEKRDKLVEFFSANIHNKYNIYYFGFIFCELLNLFVVSLSLGLTHRFLNYKFLGYGFKVWQFYQLPPEEQRMPQVQNPMCYTFPRIAGCDYYRYGTGGQHERINAICILALNIINDKVFLVIWWWFMILIFLGISRCIFRMVQFHSARLRYYMLSLRMHRYFKRNANTDKVQEYITKCSRGDWFVLYQLSKNLNRPFFMDFLVTLSRRVDPEERSPEDGNRNADSGDGILDLMLQPAYFSTQDSKDADKKEGDGDDD